MAILMSDEYLTECEQRARAFSGAYTGTSGTLAAMLLHCVAEVRRLQGALAVTIAQRDERPDPSFIDPGRGVRALRLPFRDVPPRARG